MDEGKHINQEVISRYVFKTAKKLVATNAIGSMFKAMDIRTTVATGLSRLGIAGDVKKRLLSHGIYGVHDRHYNKYSYEAELRQAIVAWERCLLEK